ncbi:MAG: DUF1266 domain-containing protein [Spirochaetales bacterium]|nr:DUF1266 domain-containing protein [Spirochaetales bacterium]
MIYYVLGIIIAIILLIKVIIPFAVTVKKIFGNFHLNKKSEEIDEDQYRALSVGAIHGEQITAYVNSLETGINTKRLSKMLRKWWDIHNREDAISVINWLISEGHREVYPLILEALKTNNPKKVFCSLGKEHRNEINEFYENINNSKKELNETLEISEKDLDNGILGWDVSRIVLLARTCFDCGFFSKEEAWKILGIANNLAHEKFSSWRELSNSVLIGGTMWGGYDFISNKIYITEDLFKKENSPWNKCEF